MLTPYEIIYLFYEPFSPTLHGNVRKNIIHFRKDRQNKASILDVGGRKSHYTIGLPINVTITDLPRITKLQKDLHLGINYSIISQMRRNRSNITNILFDDMVNTSFRSNIFDGVLAVEVLEHVEEDLLFLQQIHRILKPGGYFFMTTPNGDHILNNNPDHKRHYKKDELELILGSIFKLKEVYYFVADTKHHRLGVRGFDNKKPLEFPITMLSNIINRRQSNNKTLSTNKEKNCHIIAMCRKEINNYDNYDIS
jgi:SAM-dependent methyltransferase